MKVVKRFLVAIVMAFWAMSCLDYTETPQMSESGVVVAKAYKGQINGDVTTVNMDMNGDLGIGIGSVHVNERFDIVFKCDHGLIFTVNNADVFVKLEEGDEVTIDYTETHNGEGKTVRINFVDANKTR